jgi:hypothetical protein
MMEEERVEIEISFDKPESPIIVSHGLGELCTTKTVDIIQSLGAKAGEVLSEHDNDVYRTVKG